MHNLKFLVLLLVLLAMGTDLLAGEAPPPPSPTSVPVMDTWGLIALSLLAGAAGAFAFLRRK